jgi:hypothetical protein
MLKKGLVGPLWFTLALGDWPGGDATKARLDTAIALVRYRIIYGVANPVEALGPPDTEAQYRNSAATAGGTFVRRSSML